jgi:hypothetical protein
MLGKELIFPYPMEAMHVAYEQPSQISEAKQAVQRQLSASELKAQRGRKGTTNGRNIDGSFLKQGGTIDYSFDWTHPPLTNGVIGLGYGIASKLLSVVPTYLS